MNAATLRLRAADIYRGDPVAERVASASPLVRRIAWHVHGRGGGIEIEELQQIGMVALVEAARGFEERGIPFEPYAATRIKGAMIDELRRRAAMTRGAQRRRRQLLNTTAALSQRLGRAPSDPELAGELGIDEAELQARRDEAAGHAEVSLDDTYSDEAPWFQSDEESPFDAAARTDLSRRLAAAIGALPEREALVLQLYFVEEMNLAEIGETLGIGAARVCQIKAKAMGSLKALLGD